MSIFTPLYLKISKKRFNKPFHPLEIIKNAHHFISVPSDPRDFLKSLFFLEGLRESGSILLLFPKTLEHIYKILKHNIIHVIFYEKLPELFSKDYEKLKKQLGHRKFNFLIELNVPSNISLAYLTMAEKRICVGEKSHFPYYNIHIKSDVVTLNKFFNMPESNPQELFHFNIHNLKKIEKRFNKKGPLLFINEKDDVLWSGDKIIVGNDIEISDPEIYESLYLCDAYYGVHDQCYEFAKIFNKKIIER